MKKFFTRVLPIFLVGILVGGGIVLGTVYRAEHAMNLNLIEENAKLKEKISDEDIDDDKRAKSKSFSIDGEQVSDEIFLGVSFGETGFGTEVEFVPAEVRFFTDGDVVLYLDDEECYRTHIDDFDDIMNQIDRKKLLKVNPEQALDALDGASSYYYYYNQNGERIKSYGGYCPHSKKFWEPYKLMMGALDSEALWDELEKARKDYAIQHDMYYPGIEETE